MSTPPTCPEEPEDGRWIVPSDGCEVTGRYEHVEIPPGDRCPRFRVVHSPRHPMQTDEQHAVSRRWTEEFYRNLSVMLAVARRLATDMGHPASCRHRRCRRAQACLSRKAQDDWSFPGPWMPPCVRGEAAIEALRRRMRALIGEVLTEHGPA